jgi:hypothetical protein
MEGTQVSKQLTFVVLPEVSLSVLGNARRTQGLETHGRTRTFALAFRVSKLGPLPTSVSRKQHQRGEREPRAEVEQSRTSGNAGDGLLGRKRPNVIHDLQMTQRRRATTVSTHTSCLIGLPGVAATSIPIRPPIDVPIQVTVCSSQRRSLLSEPRIERQKARHLSLAADGREQRGRIVDVLRVAVRLLVAQVVALAAADHVERDHTIFLRNKVTQFRNTGYRSIAARTGARRLAKKSKSRELRVSPWQQITMFGLCGLPHST